MHASEHEYHRAYDQDEEDDRRADVRQLAAQERAAPANREDHVEGAPRGLEIARRPVERAEDSEQQSGEGRSPVPERRLESSVDGRQGVRGDHRVEVMDDRVVRRWVFTYQ